MCHVHVISLEFQKLVSSCILNLLWRLTEKHNPEVVPEDGPSQYFDIGMMVPPLGNARGPIHPNSETEAFDHPCISTSLFGGLNCYPAI